MSNRYIVNEAMALIALAEGTVTQATVQETLAMTTDIPADRLAFAASELVQAAPNLKQLVMVVTLAQGERPTVAALAEMMGERSVWIDDDKGEGTYSLTVKDEDDSEVAKVSVKTKLGS